MSLQSSEQIALASATTAALSQFALRHSVGLGLYRDPRHIENGSGTLVKIHARYFIVTVAHCIESFGLKQIRVAYMENKYSDQFVLLKKGTLGGTKGDTYDVGYLELNRMVVDHTPAEFLTTDQIALDYNPSKSLVFLFGFPTSLVPKNEATEQRKFRLKSLGLLTMTDEAESLLRNGNIEIALKYPNEAVSNSQTLRISVPHPEGISGGGIWIYNPNPACSISGSHNARFVGIQKSWLERRRIVLGNKVSCFFELLARDYPDLGDTLGSNG